MCRSLFTVVLVLCPFAQAAAAKPKPDPAKKYLDAAIRLYNAFEFERALEQLAKARASTTGPDLDVSIALYEGVLQLELGRDELGETAFKTALSLEPNAVLPARVSPKVQQLFEKLKTEMSKPIPPAPPPTPPPALTPASTDPAPPLVPAVQQQRRGPQPPGWWWAPAAAGVVFAGSGTALLFLAKTRSDQLRGVGSGGDFDLATAERYRSDGKLYQALGFTALSVGIACVVASAVVYFFMRS